MPVIPLEKQMECPRCDRQGNVLLVVIKKTGERVRLCHECDALWIEGMEVSKSNFQDFATYVKQYGLNGSWADLEIVASTEPR